MSRDSDLDNVLLVLTDQERHDLTSRDGLPVETDAIDRLQDDGVRFTRAYTPISICSPARASLLTGLYPHNHGLLNNVHGQDALRTNLSTDLETFGTSLRGAGYTNTYLGKWHLGRTVSPADFGFEQADGIPEAYDAGLEAGFRDYQRERGVDPDDVEIEDPVYAAYPDHLELIGGRTSAPPEATLTYYLAERTIDRLEKAAEEPGPFLHRTDFPGPHHPYVVPEPYMSMYDPADLDVWPSFRETFDGKPRVQQNYRSYRGVADLDWNDWAELRALYMGFMHFIDDQFGRILDALREFGLREDTLVVHTADHGDFAGGHRQFNKGPLMYEDTYRVPLVVDGPGVEGGGRECDELVSLLDLMPTLLELAGEPTPEDVDGRSLWPLLEDRETDTRDAVFAEYFGDELGFYTQRMVRTDRYKYVFNTPDVDELYDLDADPHELQNLIDHPDYRDVRHRLRQRLIRWMDETGDPLQEWSTRHLDSGSDG